MSKARISPGDIKRAEDFHGHECPGLWIGIRAAELCLEKIGAHSPDNPVTCVTETDMCAVDAVQALTGCTFGKGNLVHRDHGKTAFTFYGPAGSFRAVFRPDLLDDDEGEPGEQERRREQIRILAETPAGDLFDTREAPGPAPRPARVLKSLACALCGESVMESRARLLDGKTLCIPCFDGADQKR